MNNRTRGNSRRGLSRRGCGQYSGGVNMGHPQIVGVQGRAPDPARYGIYPVPAVPQGYPQAYQPVPFPPPPPVVAYPACGQVPYAAPSYPYVYPSPYVPVVYQNAVPPGYYPYAHPVPTYMPPPQQRQVNHAAQGQAHLPQLTQGEGNYPAQVPGQHHGPRLRRRHRSLVQARGRGNGRGNRGQPNRRLLGRGNNLGVVRESSARQAAQVAQRSSSQAGDVESSSLAALPVPIEQYSDVNSQGVKQEDTEYKSPPVPQYAESDEVKREPVIKQEPQ
ncbi:hypothetical protein V3481_002495 [Fusarium oxysporum f. sp. vasinfectum]|uniref:Uncharacterized protein n=1 Tax=Fusarium oxysporum f. sp. vasinfectum 25433 TaxID=1089449 RepID=X0M7H5_FUSOX|nr:hypothetical protein FOTG_02613 [Fusarium oxysporum f. sp. vasinfectum 25433]KAK2688551.1 hypothetical protein QWA68_012662 [Fusarium oxysporum]